MCTASSTFNNALQYATFLLDRLYLHSSPLIVNDIWGHTTTNPSR
jgi:hypothetical protein